MDEPSARDLKWVLQKTGYWKYYPEKLTRQDFFRVVDPAEFKKDGNGSYSLGQICDLFVNNIKFCNEDARDLPTGKPRRPMAYSPRTQRSPIRPSHTDYVHPLDVITAVFICCDPIARQDLVRLLWECKFAIPLLVRPEQHELLTLYTWPLQTIRYKPFSSESCHSAITDCKLSVFSFARIGEINVSKSNILNTVVCQSSSEYPIFFHRDCKSSTKRRSSVVEGLIETTFASIEKSDVMVLNLRGDSDCHTTELDTLVQVSDVLVIFLKKDKLNRVKTMQKRFENIQGSLKTLFVVTDANTEDDEVCDEIDKFLPEDENLTYDIIPILSMPKPELMEEITKFFNSDNRSKRDIHTVTKDLKEVATDESRCEYQMASRLAKEILNHMDELNHVGDQQTESVLPLQGETFRQLSASGKAMHREHNEDEVNRHYGIRKQCRAEQLELLKNKNLSVHKFLNLFEKVELNDTTRQLFLKNVALGLERKYRRATHQFQEEHKRMLYAKVNRKMEENDSTYEYLRALEKKMSRTAATLSSFVKEIGQMYEALSETTVSPQEFTHLPNVAVKILMDGYPVEIMDGETTTVPIKWVSAVLGELNRHIQVKDNKKSIKVKVVSILGIQSSGKSTLLNTMFGSTFSVGSGRCTRGVYMYMVKVAPGNTLAEEFDYILVVDGEGISALEYEEDLAKERELATFVLGIADVTILNIMSENTIYLRDILPISVHAFLRMDLVGIRPKCMIAHQNVDPLNKCMLVSHWHDLEKTLDEYTTAACHLEDVERLKCFRDIVKLDITKDIHCFPSYRRQYSNTDVVSSGYSTEAVHLASSVNKEHASVRSIDKFQQFISLLWTALIREHFVYEFKNTVQAEARLIADENWWKVAWKMRQRVRKAATEANIDIENSSTLEQCKTIYTRACDQLVSTIDGYAEEMKEELKTLFRSSRGIFKEPLKLFKGGAIARFDHLCISLTNTAKGEMKAMFEHSIKAIKLKIEDTRTKQEVTHYIEKERQRRNEGAAEDEGDHCNVIFKKWIRKSADIPRPIGHTREHMEVIAAKRLRDVFPSQMKYISEQFQRIGDIDLFKMTAGEMYISNWSRQTIAVRKHKELAQELISKTKAFVGEYFGLRKQKRSYFDSEVFTDLISQTKAYIEQSGILIKKTFEIDLAIGTIAYALCEFEREYSDSTLIEFTDLTSMRFRELYNGVLENENKKLALVIEQIKEGIVEKVLKQVCDEIVEDLKQYETDDVKVFHSKRTVMLLIVKELILQKDQTQIDAYLLYQTGWMRSWICKIFEKYCDDEQSANGSKLQNILATLLAPVVESVHLALEGVMSLKVDKEDRRRILQEKLSEHIGVCLTDIYMSSSEETFIESRLLKEFESVTGEFVKEASETFFEERYFDHIKVSVTNAMFESIVGCTKRCPCCGELCIFGQPNHEGKHKAFVHRPVSYIHDPKETQLAHCERHITEQKSDWEAGHSVEIESTIQFLCTELLRAMPRQDQGSREDFRIPEEWIVLTAECELQKLATELDKLKD